MSALPCCWSAIMHNRFPKTARLLRLIFQRLEDCRAWWHARMAEAELRSLDDHALHDLGLDRGGISYAARYGRHEAGDFSHDTRPPID